MFHRVVRGAFFAFAMLGLGVLAAQARVAPITSAKEPQPAWVDGTHLLAERYKDTIAAAVSRGPVAPRRMRRSVPIGGSEIFWAMNMAANASYEVKAYLRKVSKHCYIYVEDGYSYSEETLNRLAAQFDDVIYPTDRRWFGSEPTPGIDGDARITLLLLDIQDGWEPGKGYVAGYFFPLDTMSTDVFAQSNEREMFYLDTHPADPNRADYLGILAHEFQHMIHWNMDKRETKWINESLSQLAFFVCNYGHAPQIFQYLRNTDFNFEVWTNSLENYGSAYLFQYYLYLHYAGTTDEAREKFFRDLASNPKVGMDSVTDTLLSHGVSRSGREVFVDWATANVAGDTTLNDGLYGYDSSLVFTPNNPALTSTFDSVTGDTKEETLQPNGVDYIFYVNDNSVSPRRPSMIDKVTFTGAQGGSLVWTVNGNQLPPAKLIPAGSTVDDANKCVVTPLVANDQGQFVAVIGSFARLGVEIRSLEHRFSYTDGTQSLPRSLPIFSLPALVPGKAQAEAAGQLEFSIQGDKKKPMSVRAVVKRGNGQTEVADVVLDASNKGSVRIARADDIDSLVMVIVGHHAKKDHKYTYSLKKISARDTKRQVLFEGLGFGPVGHLPPASLVAPVTPGLINLADDDGDTSHDNLGYFLNKKNEIIYNLTHLMIDPQFIEGQIIKMWRLLEIIRNFPHLPLPDGLAFVDFNETVAQAIVGEWAAQHGIVLTQPVPGGLPRVTVKTGTLEDTKETAKRLVLAEKIVEFSYNNGLVLAHDFGITVFYFAKFALGAKTTLDVVAANFQHVPVIGTLVSKLKKIIVSKLIRAGDTLVNFIASKMQPPLSQIIPIAYSIISNIVCRTMDIPWDPAQYAGATKEWVVGTVGRYALASIPRVGYVARGQKAVDLASEYAKNMTAMGSYQDAVKKVWDDGDLNTDNSLREVIAQQITKRHQQAWNDQRIAWVLGKLAEVAGLVSIVDPTSISRIAAIALQIGTAGVFGHAGYTTASYFFALSKSVTTGGVHTAFNPAYTADNKLDAEEIVAIHAPSAQRIALLQAKLDDAYAEFVREAQVLAADTTGKLSFDRVLELDAQIDDLGARAEATLFGAEPGFNVTHVRDVREAALDELYTAAQETTFTRAQLLGDLFARVAGDRNHVVPLTSTYVPVFERYLQTVKTGLTTLAARSDTGAVLHVAETQVTRQGDKHVIKVVVANGSEDALQNIDVRLVSGLDFVAVDGATRNIARLGGDRETTLTFTIRLQEQKPLLLPTVTITIEAAAVKGVGKTVLVE